MSAYLDEIYQAILDRDQWKAGELLERKEADHVSLIDAWAMMSLRLGDGPLAEALTFPYSLTHEHRKGFATAAARYFYLCPGIVEETNEFRRPTIVPGRRLQNVPDSVYLLAKETLAHPAKTLGDFQQAGFRKYHLMMCIAGRLIGYPPPRNEAEANGRSSPFVTAFNMHSKEIGVPWLIGKCPLFPPDTGLLLEYLTIVGILAAVVKQPHTSDGEKAMFSEIVEANVRPADEFFDSIRGQFATFGELCEFFLRPDIFRPIAITHYIALATLDEHFGLGAYYDRGIRQTLDSPPEPASSLPPPRLLPHQEPGSEPFASPGTWSEVSTREAPASMENRRADARAITLPPSVAARSSIHPSSKMLLTMFARIEYRRMVRHYWERDGAVSLASDEECSALRLGSGQLGRVVIHRMTDGNPTRFYFSVPYGVGNERDEIINELNQHRDSLVPQLDRMFHSIEPGAVLTPVGPSTAAGRLDWKQKAYHVVCRGLGDGRSQFMVIKYGDLGQSVMLVFTSKEQADRVWQDAGRPQDWTLRTADLDVFFRLLQGAEHVGIKDVVLDADPERFVSPLPIRALIADLAKARGTGRGEVLADNSLGLTHARPASEDRDMKYWALLSKVAAGFSLYTQKHDLPTGQTVTCLALFTSKLDAMTARTRFGVSDEWHTYVLEQTFYERVAARHSQITHVVIDPHKSPARVVLLSSFIPEQVKPTNRTAVAPHGGGEKVLHEHVWVQCDQEGNWLIFARESVTGFQISTSKDIADEATSWLKNVGESCAWKRIKVDEMVRMIVSASGTDLNGWFALLRVDKDDGPQFVEKCLKSS